MALGKGRTRQVEIPHEPGEWMEFCDLGFMAKQRARELKSFEGVRLLREMGADIMQALPQDGGGDNRRPVERYDWLSVLQEGIVRWSYVPAVTPESVALLDEQTAEWAVHEILGISQEVAVPLERSTTSTGISTVAPYHRPPTG